MKASKILISMLLLVALCMSLASFPAMADGPVASVKTAGGETVEKNSLDEALQAAGKGDTVTLLQDVTLNSGITIEKDIILDLGGNVLSFTAADKQDVAILVVGAEVTVRNGVVRAVSEDEDAGYGIGIVAGKGADVTLDNLKLRYAFPGGTMLSTVKSEEGNGLITVYDGEYSQDPSSYLPGDYSATFDEEKGAYVVAPKEDETVEVIEEPEATEPPAEGTETDPQVVPTPIPVVDPNAPEEEDPKSPETAGSVTNPDGSTPGIIYYYKNSTGMGGDKTYKVSPLPEKVIAYVSDPAAGKGLSYTFTPTNPSAPEEGGTLVISESANKATLEALEADAYYLEFQFKDATAAKLDLYVILNLSLDTNRHVKNSGTPIVVTLTDIPDKVLVSDNNKLTSAKELTEGTDYTVSGNTITLKPEYLDTLAAADANVTKYFGFAVDYRGQNLAAPYAVTILPPPTIDPTAVNWKRGTEKAFTVKPDITKVSIDSIALDSSNYTASGNKLTVKPAAIANLVWGDHTLSVDTTSGPVSAKITIEPSLGWSSNTGNQHTKGGSKNIIFIASDPVTKVFVNGTEISSEHYTISDSKNITLKASYLNTLKADTTYTITVTVSNNGKTQDVSSSFKILSGGSGGSAGTAPQTGDPAPTLWAALLLVSCLGMTVVLPRLRKE